MESKVKYIPLGLLLAFGTKCLIQGLSWESVAACAIFSGLWYLLEYKSNDKKLQVLSDKLAQQEVVNKNVEILLTDFRTSISSLRMTQGLKPTTFGRAPGA